MTLLHSPIPRISSVNLEFKMNWISLIFFQFLFIIFNISFFLASITDDLFHTFIINPEFLFQFRIWPAVLRQSTYGTIKFGIYYTLKNWIDHPDVEDMMTNIFCGVIAGSISSAIANPTDVLKVRMQACSTSLQKKGMFECFGDVYRQEGLSGLWRVSSNANIKFLSVQ